MGKRIILFLMATLLFATTSSAANKKFTLVIDAGHGGHDTGAVGKISKEKTINLNVALAFGRYVEKNFPDVNVIYTRKKDVFVALHERANIANRNKADLFISIHTNALPKKRIARGLETYTLGMHRASDNFDVAKRENSVIQFEKDYKQHYEGFDPNSSESYIIFEFMQDKYMEQSVELAKYVQKRVCATAQRPNKGVKQAGFLVLRETSMPSCLIELGFISTPDEERFLNTADGIDKLGKGIYLAFADYKKKYDKNVTVPYKAEDKSEVSIPTVVPEAEKPKKETPKTKKKEKKQKGKESGDVMEELAMARMMDEEPSANENDNDAEAEQQPEAETPPAVVAPMPKQEKEEPEKTEEKPAPQPEEPVQQTASEPTGEPVFKVQILASERKLKAGDPQLKGCDGVDSYQDGGMYKYTCGSSTNYNEIYKLRKQLISKFPDAFIIAFKNGKRTNVVEAITEFKQNRNK